MQSLVNRLGKYNPREIDTIIIDEAHHAAAPTYRAILDYYISATVFGFTSTARRGDNVALGCVFDDIIFERNTIWGIENGYLTPIECQQVHIKYNMGTVRIADDGDYNQADIAKTMSGTAAAVAEVYTKYARGQTLIFAASVNEATDIVTLLNRQHGGNCAKAVFGDTKNRGRILTAYELGAIKAIVNYGVLTEGIDTPCAETIIIARPIAPTNVGLYAQMVGRGLRKYAGKESCLVIDCVGISDYPICTAATLLGEKPKEQVKAKKSDMPPKGKPVDNVLAPEQIPDTWLSGGKTVDVLQIGVGTDAHGVNWKNSTDGGMRIAIPEVVYYISPPLPDGNVQLNINGKPFGLPQ